MSRLAFVLVATLLTGCGLAAPCGNGDPFALFQYCEKRVSYPYGARWIKDGMTKESRRSDFVQCGGVENLNEGYERQSGVPAKEFIDGLNSRRNQLWTCMETRGYAYRNPSRPGLEDECNAGACLYP
jgi:hypothetical protein